MHNPISQKIILRFFKALYELKAMKKIGGIKTFTDKHRLDRRNFMKNKTDPETGTFRMEWLTFVVNDYGVSAHWLLTGKGGMFTQKK